MTTNDIIELAAEKIADRLSEKSKKRPVPPAEVGNENPEEGAKEDGTTESNADRKKRDDNPANENDNEKVTEGKKKKSVVEKGQVGAAGTSIVSVDGKLEPEEANYRLSTGFNKCSGCKFFVASNTPCQKVDFPINTDYTCDLYVAGGLKALSMVITKASVHNGVRRWAATASDTDPDAHGESCTPELFKQFISFFEKSIVKPFLGVAHYPRMKGKGVAGTVESVYVDGKKFKAKGTFADNALGDALFNAVANDRVVTTDEPNKIRISLAWWDLAHTHGDSAFSRKSLTDACLQCNAGKKIDTYTSGFLDHLAATRVPVNGRTEISLEMKSMAITRKDDATSIVDEILANQLEEDSKGTRQPQKAMVIRSNTGLPAEAYAVRSGAPENWKIQIWEDESKKTTPAQLIRASQAITGLSSEAEALEAVEVLRSEYRSLGVKPHVWPETIKPEFPEVTDNWTDFAANVVKLASNVDTAPYVGAYVGKFKSNAFVEIESDLLALETMVDELTQKSENGENMDELELNANDPFESRLIAFKSQVEEIQNSGQSTKAKALAIKSKFNDLGDVYVKNVLETEKSDAVAESVSFDYDDLTNAMATAVAQAMAPVMQQVSLLNERFAGAPVTASAAVPQMLQPAGAESVPQRKSIATAAPVSKSGAEINPYSIENISRRSVGLDPR